MCSGHGLNSGINANFARDFTLKMCKGHLYVGLVLLRSELVHKITDGPSYIVFYMSTQLSLDLFNELRKRSNAKLWRAFYCFLQKFNNKGAQVCYGLKLHSL